jgi:ATP-dependent DNA helicase DinG
VLVASASFWEGVDIPGQALQLVIIDKIPFAPPDDPLLQARCQAVEAAGGSAFTAVQLPMAAVALQQGVGRLIRRESDRGVLVVCDTRLTDKGYGRTLMAALPAMRVLAGAEELEAALRQLTTTSTTGRYSLSSP